MTKGLKYALITSSVIATVIGVAYLLRQKFLVSLTTFKVVGHHIKKLSLSNTQVAVTLSVTNQTDIDFDIYSQSYNFFINDQYVGRAISNTKAFIRSKSTGNLLFNASISPEKIARGITTNLFSQVSVKNSSVTIKGSLKIKTKLLPLSIPVNAKFTLNEVL